MTPTAIIKQVPAKIGQAYRNKAEHLQPYEEQIRRFIKDAPDSLRHDGKWLDVIVTDLTKFKKNEQGDMTGSSPLMAIFFSQYVLSSTDKGRNLITGEQLLIPYKQNENRNPFGQVYIDFGLAIRPQGERGIKRNNIITKTLISDLQKRNITDAVVPDFYMLDIKPSQESERGLVIKLNDLTPKIITPIETFPWEHEENNLLTCACLNEHDWDSDDENLGDSDSNGRVVNYDAEAVKSAK